MKNKITAFLAFLAMVIIAVPLNGCAIASSNSKASISQYSFDFKKDASGFTPIFSDYADDNDNFKSYQMAHKREIIPIKPNNKYGLFIASMNRSDDLFMGYVKKLSGLKANTEYNFETSIKLATNAVPGGIGAGGSPAESVVVKYGVTKIKPESKLDSKTKIYRMNIDTGSQTNSGKDMIVVGDMGKTDGSEDDSFSYKNYKGNIKAKTDSKGDCYLIIATDSGYEGYTSYYLSDVKISATKTKK